MAFFPDTTVLSHEIAEWADDSFGNNRVDPWDSSLPRARASYGRYSVLEVGDPTVDVWFSVDGAHHVQDWTFFSWFTRATPSSAIAGRYTSTGSLSGPAERCLP